MKSQNKSTYAHYIGQFNQAKSEAEKLIETLDDRTFRRKPSADTWCIGECFSHLVETGSKYYNSAAKGIEKAEKHRSGAKDPFHLRFHMQWFVNYLEPPVSFKSKTPGTFQPVAYASLDKDEILNSFTDLQDKYITQLEKAQGNNLDLSSIKVPNPVIAFIRMTPAECIAVTEAHQRRHLEQAKKVKNILEEKS